MNREQLIEWLTTNCDCWKHEGSADVLANFDDERLVTVYNTTVKAKQYEPIINAAQQSYKAIYEKDPTVKDLIQFVGNEDCAEENIKGDPYDFEDEDEITPKVKKPKAKPTMNEWLDSAPPEYQDIVRNALKEQSDKKAKLIKRLVGNVRNPQQKAQLTKLYQGMKLDELQLVSNSVGGGSSLNLRSKVSLNRDHDDLDDILPNYSGAATPAPTANYGADDHDDDLLIPPTMNFSNNGHSEK